jgi:hypothetical protein
MSGIMPVVTETGTLMASHQHGQGVIFGYTVIIGGMEDIVTVLTFTMCA